jgi:hypothetical protein
MRAVIKCEGELIDAQLREWLELHNWLPNDDQASQVVEQHKRETLQYVPEQDRTIAEHTHCLTLFDELTRAWGTVCRPNKHRLTFRLKHPVSERLKSACERLVVEIHGNSLLKFAETTIEVLEPQGEHQAFVGTVLPSTRWDLVKREKRTEYRVSLAAGVITVLCLAATTPWFQPIVLSPFSQAWAEWMKGILERLGTTAIVTSIVTALEVFLHWRELVKGPPIRWRLE